jgi:lipopolysaccharide biosynthesis glycosyltransferase
MGKTVAIVIFVIGQEYQERFDSIFKPNLSLYCKKYGYELIVLNKVLKEEPNMNKKTFYWQRMLIPSYFSQYDYVVSMDADIYVNPNSPPLPLDEIPEGMVAAVNERKYFNNYEWREKVQIKNGWERTGKDWYALSGENKPYHDHINAGFIIYQPYYHAEPIKDLYENNIHNYMKYHQDDQSILSSFLIDNNIIYWLDERYNRLWTFWKFLMYPVFDEFTEKYKRIHVQKFIELNYFTHFTSCVDAEYINI